MSFAFALLRINVALLKKKKEDLSKAELREVVDLLQFAIERSGGLSRAYLLLKEKFSYEVFLK